MKGVARYSTYLSSGAEYIVVILLLIEDVSIDNEYEF